MVAARKSAKQNMLKALLKVEVQVQFVSVKQFVEVSLQSGTIALVHFEVFRSLTKSILLHKQQNPLTEAYSMLCKFTDDNRHYLEHNQTLIQQYDATYSDKHTLRHFLHL